MSLTLIALRSFQERLASADSMAEVTHIVGHFFAEKLKLSCELEEQPIAVDESSSIMTLPLAYRYVLTCHHPIDDMDEAQEAGLALARNFVRAEVIRRQEMVASVAQLALLDSASRSISAGLGIDDIYTLIDQHVARAFPGMWIQVLFFDAGEKGFRFQAGFGPGVNTDEPSLLSMESFVTEMIQLATTVLIPSDLRDAADEPLPAILAPITLGNTVEGLLAVYSEEQQIESQSLLAALTSLASSIGVAISNGKLRQRLEQNNHQLDTIFEITRSARFLQPVEPTLADVHKRIIAAFEGVRSHIALYDRVTGVVSFPSIMARGELIDMPAVSIQNDDSLSCWVIRNDEPFATTDWQAADRPVAGYHMDDDARSILCFPMRAQGEVVGAIQIQNINVDAYNERDYYLLEAISSQVAVIVRNAKLHARVQQQLSELTTLYEASATMMAELDIASVLNSVVVAIVRALRIDSCSLMLWDANVRGLRVRAHGTVDPIDPSGAAILSLDEPVRTHLESSQLVSKAFSTSSRLTLDRDDSDTIVLRFLESARMQSLKMMPLVWHNQPLGLLLLGETRHVRHYNEIEQRLIENLTNQATVALEHARLFEANQKRLDELSAFQNIGLQIISRLDVKTVFETISEAALELLEINNLHIYQYDEDRGEFTFGTALWRDGRRTPFKMPGPEGITTQVARKGEPIIINDAQSHPLYSTPERSSWGVAAIAGFPLKRAERVIGVFTVTFLTAHSFGEDELLLLKLLGDQAAVAIQNAQLFDDLQRQVDVMQALVDMAQQVTGNLDSQVVMDTAVNAVQELLTVRASSIAIIENDELVIEAAQGIKPQYLRSRLRVGEGASGRAVAEGRHIYVPDTYEDPSFTFFDHSIRSLLSVPLLSRETKLGTLAVDSTQPNAFDESDIQFLQIAAAQVSVALANANLYQESENRAEQLSMALEELQRNYQLMDELVQNISHELRTPLTFVKGYVDLLLDEAMGALTEEQSKALAIVTDRCDILERIIDDIVTLQRIDADNLVLTAFSLTNLLQTAVEVNQMRARENELSLIYHEFDQNVFVSADRERLNQVLDNLIGNAIKFSPEGGKIELGVASVDEGSVTFTVRDQGIGIPKEQLKRVFERFYQVDGSSTRKYGGTGIGLSLVYRIIKAHGGRVWVESSLSTGSIFYLTLPLVEPAD